MKALQLSNGMVIREAQKKIDRNNNNLTLVFSIETKLGEVRTEEQRRLERLLSFTLEKSKNESEWKILKDASNEQTITHLDSIIKEYASIKIAYEEYQKNPKTEMVVQGEGQEPVEVKIQNPYQEEKQKIERLYDHTNTLIDFLIENNLDVDVSIVTI